MYHIYKITNLVNNKIYIGQSARGVAERFHRHVCDAMNGKLDTHFARAIRKYGPENFTVVGIPKHLMTWHSFENHSCIIGNYKIDILD